MEVREALAATGPKRLSLDDACGHVPSSIGINGFNNKRKN